MSEARTHEKLATVTFVTVAALTLVRLFFGADITDEANYSAHALTFIKDGRLFQSDLFIHGLAGAILAPIASIYSKSFGGEGFVLFLRFLYFGLVLWTSIASFQFLKNYYRRDFALVASTFYLAYIPFSIASWSYNNVAAFGVPLSLFLLFSGSQRKIWLSGFVAAISCLCYPPIAIFYAVLLVWLYWRRPATPKLGFLICIGLGGLLGGYLIFSSADLLPKVVAFSREFAWVGGIGKLKQIGDLFHRGALQAGLDFVVLGALVLHFKNKKFWKAQHDFWILFVLLLLPLILPITPQRTLSWLIFAPFMILTMNALGRFGEERPEGYSHNVSPVLKFGFLAAAVFGYTSSNILVNAGLGMILPLQILALNAANGLLALRRARLKSILGLLAAINVILVLGNYTYFYRDENIFKLDHLVKSGPYKGIFTTRDRAVMLMEVDRDLKEISRGRDTIFASYLTPAYLSTHLRPVTGMLFLFEHQWSENAVQLILHRTLEGQEWPDVVVTRTIDQPDYNYQFENFFTQSGKYSLAVEKPWYRIMVRAN